MTKKEETLEKVLSVDNKEIILEFPTGYGKTKIGMEYCFKYNPKTVLIVVPRIVLIQGWKDEFKKWNKEKYLSKVTFSTYAGLYKVQSYYDCIIFDEAHHITERVLNILKENVKSEYTIMLSATLKKDKLYALKRMFPKSYHLKIRIKEAINDEVLPDPKVFLYRLNLPNDSPTETIIKKRKGKETITCLYKDRWKYLKNPKVSVIIKCTPKEKYLLISETIEFYKKKYMVCRNEAVKNKWLKLCGERLKWLSELKNDIIKKLLVNLKDERVLTFCSSIEQTEILGKNCINSKNKESLNILAQFNEGKINHITACNILNEGCNLYDCRIGLYANLNSSDTIIIQRTGRILRHKNPVIIIPYFIHTREAELVDKMIENYNPELINIIDNLNEVKL